MSSIYCRTALILYSETPAGLVLPDADAAQFFILIANLAISQATRNDCFAYNRTGLNLMLWLPGHRGRQAHAHLRFAAQHQTWCGAELWKSGLANPLILLEQLPLGVIDQVHDRTVPIAPIENLRK